MSPRFRNGDKVIAQVHKGKIVAVTRDHKGKYTYTVKFNDTKLIPPEMDYPEQYLKPDGDEEVCPFCKTKWTVSRFNAKTWKDCRKCNKTSEAIAEEWEKKQNSPPPIPGRSRGSDDLLKEFELMLEGFDDLDIDKGFNGVDFDDDVYVYGVDDDDDYSF